jgi:hypothetical protein
MQLRNARLCLNCEEIHAAAHCPVCTSESFAYVSRWIPPEERRTEPRAASMQPPQTAPQSARPVAPRPMRWVKRGAAGVAVLAASRILWQLSRPVEWEDAEIPEDVVPLEPQDDSLE